MLFLKQNSESLELAAVKKLDENWVELVPRLLFAFVLDAFHQLTTIEHAVLFEQTESLLGSLGLSSIGIVFHLGLSI